MLPHEAIYGSSLVGLGAAAAVIGSDSKQLAGIRSLLAGQDSLARFQRLYLPGFLLAMLADWLQGPFVYALYQGYGIDREHNGYLFVAGFGASAVFGTVVGSFADKFGRRRFALLYCLIYFGHCATKHWGTFGVLLLGRVLGGISTSLLFSVFDSWLVSESQREGFTGEQLGNTFSLAYFGSSIAAIAAGQLGEIVANLYPLTEIGGGMYYGGYVTPFDLANVVLVVCMLYISSRWSENYGEGQSSGQTGSNFGKVMGVILEDKRILLCGLICSSFESSMFIFVFNWTPCLMEEGQPAPPFGHIFTGFMVFCLLGTRIYSYLAKTMAVEDIAVLVMLASAACHLTVLLFQSVTIRFLAFLLFEGCVGLYFPVIGTLKGDIVPENMRSTIYNIYRLPLNVIVLMPLLMNFSISTTFAVTTSILAVAVAAAFTLKGVPKSAKKTDDQELEEGIISSQSPDRTD
jgi:MFS family permease